MANYYKGKSFAKAKLAGFAWPINPQPGDTFIRCNFSQINPGTKIPDSFTGLIFQECNMVNIIPPADAQMVDCLNSQISQCSNLLPDLIEQGLPECPENCEHVTETETVELDGETLTFHTYQHKVI